METKDKSLEVPPQPHFAGQGAREALERVLRNIRSIAAGSRVYGHGPTPHTPERIIERKDEGFDRILKVCTDAGVVGSVLRDASPPATEAATLRALKNMQIASEMVDASDGTNDYNVRLLSLALVARQFLRVYAAALAADQPATEQE